MSDQDGRQASAPPCPSPEDAEAWKAYWKAQGQTWRTEPEIDIKRQEELAQRRAIVPDIEQGIYPFKNVKLSRADVEWLLSTHESGRGPVDWDDESQRKRVGLDLRGADLRSVDLQSLPLACLRGGLNRSEWAEKATLEQSKAAQVHLEEARLVSTHLEGAHLALAHLEEVDLTKAHLEGADLYGAHLEGAYLYRTHLEGTSLRNAFFDHASTFRYVALENEKLGIVLLSDTHWKEINLSLVNWTQLTMLGDELEAHQPKKWNGRKKSNDDRLQGYQRAVRANRQLAVALQTQGLNEDAAHFAYRAQKLQRIVLRRQKKFGQYLFSLFLDILAGYGYRPGRSVFWYLATILVFALGYHAFGQLSLWPPDAFVYSLTSFHGRGFFPGLEGKHSLHDPLVMVAAIEAVVGLLIEISFIATFTQRFFGK